MFSSSVSLVADTTDYHTYGRTEYVLKYGERKIKFKYHQLTVKWIGKQFGLYPESILLFTEADGELEVPDDSGNFHLGESKLYIVQGDLKPFGVGEAGPSSSLSASRTPMLPTGTSASYLLTNQKKNKRFSIKTKTRESPSTDTGGGWSKNIELHSYNRTGELRKTSNYPLSLTTSSANLAAVTEKISAECYSNNGVVLLDNDNFKIPCNSCTQGKKIIAIIMAMSACMNTTYSNARLNYKFLAF